MIALEAVYRDWGILNRIFRLCGKLAGRAADYVVAEMAVATTQTGPEMAPFPDI